MRSCLSRLATGDIAVPIYGSKKWALVWKSLGYLRLLHLCPLLSLDSQDVLLSADRVTLCGLLELLIVDNMTEVMFLG